MKITLNKAEKVLMARYHAIKLKLLLPDDFYGHYYVDTVDGDLCVKAKKRGLA